MKLRGGEKDHENVYHSGAGVSNEKKTLKGTVEAVFNVFNWDCTFWQAREG